MINLLPTNIKETVNYARRNTILRRWAFASLFVIAVLALISFSGLLFIRKSTENYKLQVKQSKDSLASQSQNEINAQVQDLTSSIQLVIQVLNRQVLFSELIKQIGAVMPQGAVLTGLSIDKLSGGLDLDAAVSSQQVGTQVQVNLADPGGKVFASADIISIECKVPDANSDPFDNKYPCSVQIRALFSSDNPFLFINSGGQQ